MPSQSRISRRGMLLVLAAAAVVLGLLLMKFNMNAIFARLFRNISRYKARKRIFGNEQALIPILLGTEKPVLDFSSVPDDGFTMTAAQLAEMNGENGSPLYLSVMGRIYDVSLNAKQYGKEGGYHFFVGKDASLALAKGCTSQKCLDEHHTAPSLTLSAAEEKEVQAWVEFFQLHDKYQYVGRLVEDPVDKTLDKVLRDR